MKLKQKLMFHFVWGKKNKEKATTSQEKLRWGKKKSTKHLGEHFSTN